MLLKKEEVPDRAALTLVVLSSEHSWEGRREATLSVIDSFTKEHGASARTFKSSLVWAVAEKASTMRDEARDLLAWEIIDEEKDQLRLDESKRRYLNDQLKRSKRDLHEVVWRTYKNILLLEKDGGWKRVDLGLVHSSSASCSGVSPWDAEVA